jgi:hypothetical protein
MRMKILPHVFAISYQLSAISVQHSKSLLKADR